MDIVTGATVATVVDGVDLKMAWLLFVPRDSSHRDLSGYLVGLRRPLPRQPGLILSNATQDAPHRGDADPA
jgi:hypothetical protein